MALIRLTSAPHWTTIVTALLTETPASTNIGYRPAVLQGMAAFICHKLGVTVPLKRICAEGGAEVYAHGQRIATVSRGEDLGDAS